MNILMSITQFIESTKKRKRKALIDDSSGPLISIIMPMYNAQYTLFLAVESIKNQTYGFWIEICNW